ncbi:unnamed protein product, partial [Rhizoctonia solani]
RRREVAERREREERARYEQQKRDSQTKEAELRAQEERRAAEDMLAREQRRVEEERRLREEQRVEEARRREAAERREREERARYEQQKRDSEDRKRRWASDITTAAVERPNRARDRKRTKATELRTQEESRASKEPPVRRQHAEARRRKGAERANSEEHKGENEEQKRAPWELYKQRWSTLSATSSNEPIGFQDIPWPILRTPTDPESITLQTINHGTLTRYLDNNTEVDRCNLCAQISDGLSYLHEIGIVHGDLKGANVLTLADGTPVLNDFGNSMFSGQGLQFTETTRNGTLTVRWAAPELLDESSDCKPSKSADVYALGMTMLEVITGKPPYDGKGDFVVLMLVSTKKHPERPIKCIPSESRDGDKFWQLLEKCWAFIPEQRPSAAAVTTVMKSITPQGLNATNTPQH